MAEKAGAGTREQRAKAREIILRNFDVDFRIFDLKDTIEAGA